MFNELNRVFFLYRFTSSFSSSSKSIVKTIKMFRWIPMNMHFIVCTCVTSDFKVTDAFISGIFRPWKYIKLIIDD